MICRNIYSKKTVVLQRGFLNAVIVVQVVRDVLSCKQNQTSFCHGTYNLL